jgi:hypothetical protein
MSKVNPDLMQVRPFKIWFFFVHNSRGMDEQAEINKDAVTKCKVTEVGSSIREVFIMMKMLETQVGQLVRRSMGSKGRLSVQSQGPTTTRATQTHSGDHEDHDRRTGV